MAGRAKSRRKGLSTEVAFQKTRLERKGDLGAE
jgi:hypothetical protein